MLTDVDFELVYTTGDNEPVEFFFNALCNSSQFDLGLGFFHSSGFRALAFGFAKFIHLNGKMRIIINDQLEEEDKAAIEKGYLEEADDLIEKRIIRNFDRLWKTLSKRDEHFFNCLTWLIAANRLDIRAVVPVKGNKGIAHQKYGVFYDDQKNRLSFSGSLNFSYQAFKLNIETINCQMSWTNEKSQNKLVDYYANLFNEQWTGRSNVLRTIPLKRVMSKIRDNSSKKSFSEILKEEELLMRSERRINQSELKGEIFEIHDSLDVISSNNKPQFPFPEGPRAYQIDAYHNWVKKNYQGIFAMATGTGKTITALNCVLEEYKKNEIYHLLILVPSSALVHQWKEEISKFNFTNIYEISGSSNWRKDITILKNKLKQGLKEDFIIISIYDSFVKDVAQKLISEINSETENSLILIADEAHNIGRTTVRNAFEKLTIKKRIALSATPKRIYDPEGTRAIEDFFSDTPPYCYNFSLDRAITEGFLSSYYYYPILVRLTESELEEYIKITRKLQQSGYLNNDTKDSDKIIDILLQERKRIIHKAENKNEVLRMIIKDIGEENLKYCFLYAPEGEYEETDESIMNSMMQTMVSVYPTIRLNSVSHKHPSTLRKRFELLKGFEEGRIDVLFAMKILDEGIDIPRTEIGIFSSSIGNPRQFIQRRGRLLRLHPKKQNAKIYDMVVTPDFTSKNYDDEFYKIEKKLMKVELTRVAYFASLSLNFDYTRDSIKEITNHYNLSIDTIINELKDE